MDVETSATLIPLVPAESGASEVSSPPSACRRRWRVSLVLPAYNEQAVIRQAILEACAALSELTDSYEILVVDDGSSDDTADIVAELAVDRPQVRLLRHDENRGYGAALRTGFTAARFERVAFTDADCQFHLVDLGRLLPLSDRYPLVVGWRQARQDPWRRRFLSRGYNLLTRTLLGTKVRDCDCALKVFRRETLAELMPETNTFFVNAEMLTKACQHGLPVAEVGVRHRSRPRGVSKVSLLEVPRIVATLLPFWWSRVLFPCWMSRDRKGAEKTAPLRSRLNNSQQVSFALLLLMAVSLFFLSLRAPLLEPQEPRYAEIPRQMLQQGRLLVPVLHGQAYLDKPPLLYWMVMGSYAVFGVHDWAARLVPGLAGVLTVLLTYLWGRRAVGERAGLCGALILCLSAGFIYRQRMLNMDSLLCLWITAALAASHTALTCGPDLQRRWWLLAAAACGLGLLTKGPVTLVLVLTPLFLYTCLEPRCARVAVRDWIVFVVLAVLLAAPWYVAVMLRQEDFAYSFFWRHHIERFLTPFDHAKPAWYYLPGLLAGMLPATLLLPGFMRFLSRRSLRAARRRPAALGFFLLSALWCLLFFSASGCKRPAYILPVMPGLALALGCYLNAFVPRSTHLARRVTLFVLGAAFGIFALAGFLGLLDLGSVLMLEAAALASLLWLAARRVSWPICTAVTFAVLVCAVTYLQPAYNRRFALRDQLPTEHDLAAQRTPVICYPQRWDSVSFYLPHADVRVYSRPQLPLLLVELRSRRQTLLLVKSGRTFEELQRQLPASMEMVAHGPPSIVTAAWVRRRPAWD